MLGRALRPPLFWARAFCPAGVLVNVGPRLWYGGGRRAQSPATGEVKPWHRTAGTPNALKNWTTKPCWPRYALAERRVLGALLNPARIAESSTTALQGVWKITGELQQELARRTGARGHGGRRPFCMDAVLIADGFAPLRRDILAHAHTEYLLPGGGAAPKSSFASLMLLELLMRHEDMHALCVRQVAATLRDSVFAQVRWPWRRWGWTGPST